MSPSLPLSTDPVSSPFLTLPHSQDCIQAVIACFAIFQTLLLLLTTLTSTVHWDCACGCKFDARFGCKRCRSGREQVEKDHRDFTRKCARGGKCMRREPLSIKNECVPDCADHCMISCKRSVLCNQHWLQHGRRGRVCCECALQKMRGELLHRVLFPAARKGGERQACRVSCQCPHHDLIDVFSVF
jgi:hypothetical protein